MTTSAYALRLLDQEVGGLVHRLRLVKPFALHETMVPAAMPRGQALGLIDQYLQNGRDGLLASAERFQAWLRSPHGLTSSSESAYRRYVFLRLQATAALTQFDLFADAITQRSETDTGTLLRGLEVLAEDALLLPSAPYRSPAVLCYLDRGIGAAIRRARTRLPGGGANPVAIIRIPRERMVGLGIASSLVHEVGHQGAALLNLIPLLRHNMEPMLQLPQGQALVWKTWHRWISEIVADVWSVARVGLASTLGLINVVSLPRAFVFRPNLTDPHPTPWLRVLLSAEIGRQLYPHAEWDRLRALWQQMYPVHRTDVPDRAQLKALQDHIPHFVHWLLNQAVPLADHRRIRALLHDPAMAPAALHEHLERWKRHAAYAEQLRPCQAFALTGYARLKGDYAPAAEAGFIHRQLLRWALQT